jgi:DNA-binding SARP family transcriptional activator
MAEKLRMEHWVKAQVVDPHHLQLKEPIQTPRGSTVVITIGPAQTVVQDPALCKRPAQDLQVSSGENEPALRIFALGSTRVYQGAHGIPLSNWKYAKTREMFFFLLCHPPRTKEQIGAALWPEASPAQLCNNFRVALYHLRHALGRPEWIRFENERYTFNRALPYWFDVEVFEQEIAESRRHIAARDDLSAVQCLRSAADLYRGEFMDGWNAGEWPRQRRQELESEYLDALLMLGRLYAHQAQHSQAMKMYRKAIAVDGYLEVAHRELMRCYARTGEYGEAARHYQALSGLLRDELGVLPSPESQALYTQLLQGSAV